MRSAMICGCGLLIIKKAGTARRCTSAKYLTHLDFAG